MYVHAQITTYVPEDGDVTADPHAQPAKAVGVTVTYGTPAREADITIHFKPPVPQASAREAVLLALPDLNKALQTVISDPSKIR